MLAILGNTLNQNVTVGIDACLTQLNEQHTPNLPKSTICKYIQWDQDIKDCNAALYFSSSLSSGRSPFRGKGLLP